MKEDKALRQHVLNLLDMKGAHAGFRQVVSDFPAEFRGIRPQGAAHTPWLLLEHMRIAQWDILDFCRNPEYRELEFPAGCWPPTESPEDDAAWNNSVQSFLRDLEEMKQIISNPEVDLFAKIRWGTGQTILREALLAADHNAYHLGQLVLLRRLCGAWRSDFSI